jgi:hypothetical protein
MRPVNKIVFFSYGMRLDNSRYHHKPTKVVMEIMVDIPKVISDFNRIITESIQKK